MVVGVCLDCDKPDRRRFDVIYYHQTSSTNNDAPGLKMQHCHKAQHKHVEQKKPFALNNEFLSSCLLANTGEAAFWNEVNVKCGHLAGMHITVPLL